jgi:hypothetical protein
MSPSSNPNHSDDVRRPDIITAKVEGIILEGDYDDVPSVEVVCSRCGHRTRSFGQHGASIRRCLALLREECPEGQTNFYVGDQESLE